MGYFKDERHALFAGAIIGIAMRHGLDVRPVVDDDGNYTDRLIVTIPARPTTFEFFGPKRITLTLVVPPPPDDWNLSDWA